MSGWPNYPPQAGNGQAGWGAPPADPGVAADPTPRRQPSPRLKLETAAHCRRELARIYREARRGELKPETATKLAYLIDLISRVIERSDLERRVEELEGQGK